MAVNSAENVAQIENLTLSIDVYLLEEQSCQISSRAYANLK